MITIAPIKNTAGDLKNSAQKHVLELRCEPVEKVRIGFIGMGMRMSATIKRFIHIKDAEIVALCDISQEKLANAKELIESNNHSKVAIYSNIDDWKKFVRERISTWYTFPRTMICMFRWLFMPCNVANMLR